MGFRAQGVWANFFFRKKSVPIQAKLEWAPSSFADACMEKEIWGMQDGLRGISKTLY